MNGSWSSPMDGSLSEPLQEKSVAESKGGVDEDKYYALIVDSGAIIKHSGFSTLHNSASKYITTQGVIDEIRDSKARHHLESLPFQLNVREPTQEGITKVAEFSKKTGDYASLSRVDLHVLALLYDLEKEGCENMEHIRLEPKRMIGNGKLVNLKKEKDDSSTIISENQSIDSSTFDINSSSFFESAHCETEVNDNVDASTKAVAKSALKSNGKKSWAALVNPTVASSGSTINTPNEVEAGMSSTFASMTLNNAREMLNTMHEEKNDDPSSGGQFSDAEDDDSILIPDNKSVAEESSDDGDEYASIGDDFSDEECDVYVLDPEEVEEKERLSEPTKVTEILQTQEVLNELEMEFPSLAASQTVPYEGSDDENETEKEKATQLSQSERLKKAAEEERKGREESLQPISKSGKLYNSLGKYKKLTSKEGIDISSKKVCVEEEKASFSFTKTVEKSDDSKINEKKQRAMQSRVIGGVGMSGQSNEVDDDGEGWITCTKEIVAMKATGTLDPFRSKRNNNQAARKQENLPTKQYRTACATTDFAMQNVMLQMNLELLTVDGVRVRKLKSWVQRCSTCFEVYTAVESSRLFCDRCGSSSIQRVAASVDGKTGRLKLHLKKNYQYKLRGTKFSLPKSGKQNRFMGDLLLSEDQLMYGALNKRVKQGKSKNAVAAQSIFGADIASNVGCIADLSKSDIKVGFGRKNPNATKFGRERRGKKKQSGDKACGLRRY